jgi:hypothetical protein
MQRKISRKNSLVIVFCMVPGALMLARFVAEEKETVMTVNGSWRLEKWVLHLRMNMDGRFYWC